MKKLMFVKLGLDILMAVTFVLFFNKQVLGGLTFHEIAGLVIAVLFFIHVLLNWRWVKKVTVKLFDLNLPLKTKFGYFFKRNVVNYNDLYYDQWYFYFKSCIPKYQRW
ncbi:hypothetical protein [Peribacillus simplex]|uniref:DUF4405 domain-containing protein n=1 Tax=Peribacillus simplex TaxID=1478 RepID=A0AAW7IB16_9BACI|nr:hypothetical protein [Peribacillus simplex]MDM5452123.1 hypothetical protein [Peribacillus simplex]